MLTEVFIQLVIIHHSERCSLRLMPCDETGSTDRYIRGYLVINWRYSSACSGRKKREIKVYVAHRNKRKHKVGSMKSPR